MQPTSTEPPSEVAPLARPRAEESTGHIVAGLASDARHLAEDYFELAKLEVARAARHAVWALVGGVLLFIGALVLAFGAGAALSESTTLSRGEALLVIGGLFAVAGAAGVIVFANLKRSLERTPKRSMRRGGEPASP